MRVCVCVCVCDCVCACVRARTCVRACVYAWGVGGVGGEVRACLWHTTCACILVIIL